MSMLAEPRQRQKWSTDPRNTAWSTDDSRFGYQLMKKMGWSDGKGLGAQEHGDVSHVKIKKKDDNLGVGAKKSYGDTWLAHQDDFTAILSNLNSINGEKEESAKQVVSLESAVKKSRKKIMYSKFIKSKDLSRASDRDMVGIFGPKSKSCPASPQVVSEAEDEGNKSDSAASGVISHSHGFTTISSTCSMQDYFARKVKALKEKGANVTSLEVMSQSVSTSGEDAVKKEGSMSDSEESGKKKKKKKRKHAEVEDKIDFGDLYQEVGTTNFQNATDVTASENSIRHLDTTHTQENGSEETDVQPRKKKKKKMQAQTDSDSKTDIVMCIDETPEVISNKKKKKKKKKSDIDCDEKESKVVDVSEYLQCDYERKKKKKKKKNRSYGE